MQKKIIDLTLLKVFFIYLAFTCLITFPLIAKLQTAIYGPFWGTYLRGAVWALWWRKVAITNHLNYPLSPFLSAPFGLDLSGEPIFWISRLLLDSCLRFFSPIFTLNILTLISFPLAATFVFCLAFFLTRSLLPSFICGLIFAFSPYHLNKAMEFSFFFIGTWVAPYIWGLFELNEKTSFKKILLTGLALTLIISINAYYAFFSFLCTIFFVIFLLLYGWREKLHVLFSGRPKIKFTHTFICLRSILLIFAIAAIISLPSLVPMIKNIFFSDIENGRHVSTAYFRDINYLVSQSARPLSFLLPASSHPIFGSFTKKMFGSIFYGRGSIEQTLYLGWVPLILAFIAFRQWRHRRTHPDIYPGYSTSVDNFYIGFFIFTAWVGS